jgi:hypothetical protein
VPFLGFDDIDPLAVAGLTCHIELEMTGGETPRDVATLVAEELRKAAALIEAGALDTGFHPIPSDTGESMGQIYLDFFGEG